MKKKADQGKKEGSKQKQEEEWKPAGQKCLAS